MTIIVNTEFLLNYNDKEYRYFLTQAFDQIARDHPEYNFILIHKKDHDEKFVFGNNVTCVRIKTPVLYGRLLKWWYDIKVRTVLNKYKPDILVSCDGYGLLNTKTPQCIFIGDLSFLHSSQYKYLKKYIPNVLQQANSVVTFSESVKRNMLEHYKINSERIHVIHPVARDIFYPLPEEEKEATRQKYTGGKNYFIYSGAIHPRHNLLNLLKAFSIFKKRQKSDWKLLLAGKLVSDYNDFHEKIRSYKHRDDVIWLENVEEQELPALIGSSYALVHPVTGFSMSPLQAINCHIPVIVPFNDSMQEKFGEAASYMTVDDHNDIADKMMMMYKDEAMRRRLIEKGKLLIKDCNWNQIIDRLWQTILKAVR